MYILRWWLLASALVSSHASSAALVPVPDPRIPLPPAGWEPNRGQAKPEVLFLTRCYPGVAIGAQFIQFAPLGVRQNFVGSNPNSTVRFIDPLPGVVNSLTGADSRNWITGIPRFGGAELTGVYPGVDVRYLTGPDGLVTLKLIVSPGVDSASIALEVPAALNVERSSVDGSLVVRLGPSRVDPLLYYPKPAGLQAGAARKVDFQVRSRTQFGFVVEDADKGLPLEIEIALRPAASLPVPLTAKSVSDPGGSQFIAAAVPDGPGQDPGFPATRWAGCGESIAVPITCTDAAVYKFSKSGELVFATYLAGRTSEDVTFLQWAPDGSLVLTGNTDSSDFPVTAAALQPAYGGPAAAFLNSSPQQVVGDFFAARLDPATGALRSSTYFGGPEPDSIGKTRLGSDGSVYFIPKWLGKTSAKMPVSPGALQGTCPGDPCTGGYAAHLTPPLDRLLYGTYLPGVTDAAELHTDGSVYYAGTAPDGFPVTPTAYQRQNAGKYDGIVARLDAQGRNLVFATYIGGPDTDWILRMALAPDGSVWVSLSSFIQCCIDIKYRLIRFDANGGKILAEKAIDIGDIAVDPQGNLIATAGGPIHVSPNAFLGNACANFDLVYVRLSPAGEQLFATYLPSGTGTDFDGVSARGLPLLRIGQDRSEIIEGQSMGVYTGCVVDAASFGNSGTVSPGEIVTFFGSDMGPKEGAAFELQNGRVPLSVSGTRVLVNGEPIPILFASYWQVNAILPFSLGIATRPKLQVERNGEVGKEVPMFLTQRASISLFRVDDSSGRPAAALNEDGTVNSAANPAKRGARVVLYGTGGGATVPALVAGEVAPLKPIPLEYAAKVKIAGGAYLTVEYSGAAPGLVAGVNQINVKLPDETPVVSGYPRGVLPLVVETPGNSYYPGYVSVAVKVD
jgi:uncharacterized protein (TIGR03437 family)